MLTICFIDESIYLYYSQGLKTEFFFSFLLGHQKLDFYSTIIIVHHRLYTRDIPRIAILRQLQEWTWAVGY